MEINIINNTHLVAISNGGEKLHSRRHKIYHRIFLGGPLHGRIIPVCANLGVYTEPNHHDDFDVDHDIVDYSSDLICYKLESIPYLDGRYFDVHEAFVARHTPLDIASGLLVEVLELSEQRGWMG